MLESSQPLSPRHPIHQGFREVGGRIAVCAPAAKARHTLIMGGGNVLFAGSNIRGLRWPAQAITEVPADQPPGFSASTPDGLSPALLVDGNDGSSLFVWTAAWVLVPSPPPPPIIPPQNLTMGGGPICQGTVCGIRAVVYLSVSGGGGTVAVYIPGYPG